MALAHSVQEEPSQIRIVPRRDYLTIQIVGAAIDWHDAVSKDPHHDGHPAGKLTANENTLAGEYARTHLVLEQGGQVLPLTVQTLQWRKLRENDETSERVEIFLRAARPAKLAASPLNVASDLFTSLEKAATIVELGNESKVLRGAETAEFAAAKTLPTSSGDLTAFAVAGATELLHNLPRLLLLATLLLGVSLLPARQLVMALGGLLLGQSLSFLLALNFDWGSVSSAASVLTVSIVALACLAWW
ncbi:MAG: hypothetical protein EOP02_23200, partial [Proteobacteria bacterium]